MESGRIYRFAGLELDPQQGCFRREGQEYFPRSKVLHVLIYLLEHRDRLVPKQELIDKVWTRTAVTDDAVFHCVAEIRALLGDTGEDRRFVRTVPGGGYRFVAPVDEIPTKQEPPRAVRSFVWVGVVAGLALICAGIGLAWRQDWWHQTPAGEVAWWRLDEGAGRVVRDSSGRDNNGVLEGAPVWTAGMASKALQLDGVGTQVVGADTGRSLPRGSDPRTVSTWIRTSSTNGDITAVFHYGHVNREAFGLELESNGRCLIGAGHEGIEGRTRLDDGRWHFLAATYEGPSTNLLRLYVDGVAEAQRKLKAPLHTDSGSPWRIGRFMLGGTPFRGTIDDVRVFSRALSATQLAALYRCTSRQADLTLDGGRQMYYLPVFADGSIEIGPQGEIVNPGGFAGVQFAHSDGTCSLESLRGASLGEDISVGADLLVPAQAGQVLTAGPYFRSRAAAPGDGIVGGTSAGYWVQLDSDGVVRVRLLNPQRVVAFTNAPATFDRSHFHRLAALARGAQLQVKLDGVLLEFDQGGRQVRTVSIPPAWDGPPKAGTDRGTAGIAFWAEPRVAGGQQARNLVVSTNPRLEE